MASSISDHEGQGYDNLTRGSNFQCNSAGPFSSRAIAWLANLRRHMHGGSPLPSTPRQDSCRPGPAQGKLIDYLSRCVQVDVLLSIWRIIFAGNGTVSGMTLGAVLPYTLIAEVAAQPPRSPSARRR
jgi:hypothetical protein